MTQREALRENIMTDLEINKAIHEKVMQECWHDGVTDATFKVGDGGLNTPHWCPKCRCAVNPPDENGDYNPSYTSDLNAVHRAEMHITAQYYPAYLLHLRKSINIDGFQGITIGMLLATARQRAEAVLRATGNWEGE